MVVLDRADVLNPFQWPKKIIHGFQNAFGDKERCIWAVRFGKRAWLRGMDFMSSLHGLRKEFRKAVLINGYVYKCEPTTESKYT